MSHSKRGSSAHTQYRHARARVATLEAQYAKVERSRPRSTGKRGWRTRRLNKISNQLRGARGLLTKARKAVAGTARLRTTAKRIAKQKRATAAHKGWAKRRMPKVAAGRGDFWQHLMPGGRTKTLELDKADSSLEGKFWNAYTIAAEGKGDLEFFRGRSVFDVITQQRYPFVVDLDEALQHADEIDFGPGFYKKRNQTPGQAA